jgi:hypothetical protein
MLGERGNSSLGGAPQHRKSWEAFRFAREEFKFLWASGLRRGLGKYVETEIASCQVPPPPSPVYLEVTDSGLNHVLQHHDSNLINVQSSRLTRVLDTDVGLDPFTGDLIAEIKGNKATESLSTIVARFVIGCVKRDQDWRSFMVDKYCDFGGIPVVKSSRFWCVPTTITDGERRY